MIQLQVALTLLRELLRALLVPLRVLAYLPFRHHWRRAARAALATAAAAPPEDPERCLVEFFAKAKPRGGRAPHLFLSAGEASGEMHAVRLLTALPRTVRCTAFGGAPLLAAGAAVRCHLSEHAVMGVRGVLRQLPLILRAFTTFLRLLRDDPPDLVVLVDYPGLHLVMAKACRRAGVPVLHYVAPQYWAWGPWRLRRYRRAVDATLTILPFETAFFRAHRTEACYIGHPLLDELADHPPDPATVAELRQRPLLVLLPGSRSAEIRANLPGLLRVARAVRTADASTRVVVVHRHPRRLELLRTLLAGEPDVELHDGPLSPWLAAARLTLAKSGTGSLEACLHGNPTLVVYQLGSWLAALGYRTILSVPWIAAANLIADREVAPEFCFRGDAGWDRVTTRALQLWCDGADRDTALAGLQEVRRRLGAPGATARTAAIVRRFLDLP